MRDEIISRAARIAEVSTDDELLIIYCEDAMNYVRAFCHLREITEELCGVTAQIAAAAFAHGSDAMLSSITEGDRQITYAVTNAAQGFDEMLRAFVNCRCRVPSEVSSDV